MRLNLRRVFAHLFTLSLIVTLLLYYFSGYAFHHVIGKKIILNHYSKCDVVHIGIVHIGYKSTTYLYNMLKSLYFYRSNPLHFHIIADNTSLKILKTMFETWDVSQVTTDFYNVNNLLYDQWLMSEYPKLMFPQIISTNITSKIIVVDTNLIFTDNIYELWSLFEDFKPTQVIGLTAHKMLQKPYIFQQWSETDERFDTDVILYQLQHLEMANWNIQWTRIIIERKSSLETSLTDQDIINAVIKENLDSVYSLPYQWNDNIVHWNSTKNFDVNNTDERFKRINASFLDYNGTFLRHQLYDCANVSKTVTTMHPSTDLCFEYRQPQTRQWTTLLFFTEFQYRAIKDDVTIISQLSYDRLHMIEELAKLWGGPVSITLYLTDSEFYKCKNFIESSIALRKRLNIAYHAVFKEGNYYPVNMLRNVALRNVVTPYIFIVDIDFLPMPGLYPVLMKYLGGMQTMYKKALVVAAFETKSKFPKTKLELLGMVDNKTVSIVHYKQYKPGHAPTNYAKWRTAKVPYKVKWRLNYEPYIVVQKNVTEFNKMFFGFGFDKASHIMELRAQGYEFVVLPEAFIIHKEHPASNNFLEFLRSRKYRTCLINRRREFAKMINNKYGSSF